MDHEAHPVHLDPTVPPDLEDPLDPTVGTLCPDPKGHLAHLAPLVKLETPVPPDPKAHPVSPAPEAARDSPDQRDHPDHLDLPEALAETAFLATQDLRDPPANPELAESPAQLDHQEHPDHRGPLVHPARMPNIAPAHVVLPPSWPSRRRPLKFDHFNDENFYVDIFNVFVIIKIAAVVEMAVNSDF